MQKNVTSGRRKGCPNYLHEFKQQLTVTVKLTSDHSHQASKLVSGMLVAVNDGNAIVNEVIDSIVILIQVPAK